ncbi:MAG: hypothetical protein PHX61_13150 [Alphaproteobacteria bacterium]|nr:hypothetical protein [Alphaproteobacteria bacterium]
MFSQQKVDLANLTQDQLYSDDFLLQAFGEAVQGRITKAREYVVSVCKNDAESLTRIWEVFCCKFDRDTGLKRVQILAESDENVNRYIKAVGQDAAGVYI